MDGVPQDPGPEERPGGAPGRWESVPTIEAARRVPEAPPVSPRRGWRRYWAPIVAALAKIKILLLFGSVLLSLLAYGLAFGWRFGALFLLILAVHETGHTLAIRRRGLPASLPIFIPFLGALINLRRRPCDAGEEAYIAAAGPLFGLGASYALLLGGMFFHVPVLMVAAGFGMLLHIFNLLPVTPLDGGRMVAFLRWRAWIPGFALLLLLLFYNPASHSIYLGDPLALVILAFIVFNAAGEARRRPRAGYDAIPAVAKWTYSAVWLILLLLASGGYVLAPRPGLI